jgi:hypothetical protein
MAVEREQMSERPEYVAVGLDGQGGKVLQLDPRGFYKPLATTPAIDDALALVAALIAFEEVKE